MQLYDITIAPNTTRQLDAPGSYFYYYTGNAGGADSTITMRGLSSGLRIVLKPGQAFRLPRGESETSWVLTNFSNTATILGTVIVGDGDITDNRITGSVEVIDGGKARTFSNSAFMSLLTLGATVGQISHLQIFNPIASGKNVIIESLIFNSVSAAAILLRGYATPLTGLYGNGKSKKIGAPDSAAELRTQHNAAILPTSNSLFGIDLAASATLERKLSEPIILLPGNGLVIVPTSANVGLNANTEWYEENI